MRARAELRAEAPLAARNGAADGEALGVYTPTPGCRLTRVRDAPPVAFRATPEAVYLVGTAASPVGDDQVSIDVQIGAGATLAIRSAASAIAWTSTNSSIEVNVSIGSSGSLDWRLQPLIASASCHFSHRSRVRLRGDASLYWAEEVVLGRHGEGPGCLDLRLDVDVDDAPLLRHQLLIGPDAPGWDGPALIGANRVIGFVLIAGAASRGVDHAVGDGWAVMPLEGPGTLISAVAGDLPTLRAALAQASG